MLATPTRAKRLSSPPRRSDPAQVLDRGADDVDARVGVVDPVDRHLVDAQPGRSARTSSSVSKNQAWSSTRGRSALTVAARPALKPHWASEKRLRRARWRRRL